jgi:hypothetical protein
MDAVSAAVPGGMPTTSTHGSPQRLWKLAEQAGALVFKTTSMAV